MLRGWIHAQSSQPPGLALIAGCSHEFGHPLQRAQDYTRAWRAQSTAMPLLWKRHLGGGEWQRNHICMYHYTQVSSISLRPVCQKTNLQVSSRTEFDSSVPLPMTSRGHANTPRPKIQSYLWATKLTLNDTNSTSPLPKSDQVPRASAWTPGISCHWFLLAP